MVPALDLEKGKAAGTRHCTLARSLYVMHAMQAARAKSLVVGSGGVRALSLSCLVCGSHFARRRHPGPSLERRQSKAAVPSAGMDARGVNAMVASGSSP